VNSRFSAINQQNQINFRFGPGLARNIPTRSQEFKMKHVALKSLAFAACALGFSALPASAGVIVYTFDQDGCSGSGCGLTNYGTVTLTDISGGVNVKVSLLNGSGLIDTGAMSGHSLTFNLAGAPSVTFTNLPSLWTTTGPANWSPNGGWGTFNYILDCNTACGSNNPWTTGLDFDVAGTGITTASFIDSGTAKDTYFLADISNPNGGTPLTGRIGASYSGTGTTTQVPEPFTMSLFGAGLAGMATLRRRRKLRAAVA